MNKQELESQIREMAPWHHDIQINEELSTGKVFSPTGTLRAPENGGVSLISPRTRFMRQLNLIFPDGVEGKRMLDCACNAGGYCFWAVEAGFASAYGFDIRDHWINQGKFVQQHRGSELNSERVTLDVHDLYDLPSKDIGEVDFTYFSGIFYHLPDPVTGLKLAADLTREVLYLNTSMMPVHPDGDDGQPKGMTMVFEGTEELMSGVHHLSWFPNNPHTLFRILNWLGFEETLMTMDNNTKFEFEAGADGKQPSTLKRRRVGIYAAREKGRLDQLAEYTKKVNEKKNAQA